MTKPNDVEEPAKSIPLNILSHSMCRSGSPQKYCLWRCS